MVNSNDAYKAFCKRGKAEKYEMWTKTDLYKRAKDLELSGRSKLNNHLLK